MKPITKTAPSKINLYLKVTGKRDDGYHTITTVFLPLYEVYDLITLSGSSELSISCDSPGIPCDEKNLCWQAAGKYAENAGIDPSWHIDIKKKIPIAAGMGGGSSDAASILTLLQNEYNALTNDKLHEIAVNIGADVPFFLAPALSLATGIGDDITAIEADIKLPLLLVAPQFPVYAKWAYSNMIDSEAKNEKTLINNIHSGNIDGISENIHNDLAPAIFNKFPLLTILRDKIYQHDALKVEISGSGPTLFAVFENNALLKNAYANLASELDKSIEIIPVFA
jgi:4-diphosphocytidyl-2-C-methyl-D-erythritol kinase